MTNTTKKPAPKNIPEPEVKKAPAPVKAPVDTTSWFTGK